MIAINQPTTLNSSNDEVPFTNGFVVSPHEAQMIGRAMGLYLFAQMHAQWAITNQGPGPSEFMRRAIKVATKYAQSLRKMKCPRAFEATDESTRVDDVVNNVITGMIESAAGFQEVVATHGAERVAQELALRIRLIGQATEDGEQAWAWCLEQEKPQTFIIIPYRGTVWVFTRNAVSYQPSPRVH